MSVYNVLVKDRYITIIILIVMLTQFVFIEGYSISPIKIVVMSVMPLFLIFKVPYISKAFVLGTLYFLCIILSALFHLESFRFSTLGYLGMFVVTYITVYNLVYKGGITLVFFIKFTKWMILSYAICLILQQMCILIGIRFMPILNLCNQFFLDITKLPSLSLEPSHSARILGILFYSYIECIAIEQGKKLNFFQLFKSEHRFVILGFLWSMLTMGSGTAFISVGIISLYFVNWRNAIWIVPFIISLVYIGHKMDIKQLNRTLTLVEMTFTMDNKAISEVDNSASYRIGPIINTINNLDLTKKEHWFGYGIDSGVGLENKNRVMVSEITDYGFLAYLFGLLLVFSCSIKFISIPTIMFFVGVGGGTSNIAYQWGILMILMIVRYFKKINKI